MPYARGVCPEEAIMSQPVPARLRSAEEIPAPPWHRGNLMPTAEEVYDWVQALPRDLALRVVEEHLERSRKGFFCHEMQHTEQIQSLSDRFRQAVRQRDAAYAVMDEGRDIPPDIPAITRGRQARVEFQLALIKLGTRLIDRASDRLGVTSR
jgi:hypothetical protein